MSIPVWPASLPQLPLVDGFIEQPEENKVETEMDAGPSKSRPLVTFSSQRLNFNMKMDWSQLATFRTFFKTTLKDGALTFTWTHPVTGLSTNWRFVSTPQWTGANGGVRWIVTLQLKEVV